LRECVEGQRRGSRRDRAPPGSLMEEEGRVELSVTVGTGSMRGRESRTGRKEHQQRI
jgi:hypothetical protein